MLCFVFGIGFAIAEIRKEDKMRLKRHIKHDVKGVGYSEFVDFYMNHKKLSKFIDFLLDNGFSGYKIITIINFLKTKVAVTVMS